MTTFHILWCEHLFIRERITHKNSPLTETSITEGPCHGWSGEIKITPYLDAMTAEQRPRRYNPFTAIVTFVLFVCLGKSRL